MHIRTTRFMYNKQFKQKRCDELETLLPWPWPNLNWKFAIIFKGAIVTSKQECEWIKENQIVKWNEKPNKELDWKTNLKKKNESEKHAFVVEYAWCSFCSFKRNVCHLNLSPSNFKASNSKVSLVLWRGTTNSIHDFPLHSI
jgi:hypothetical protein